MNAGHRVFVYGTLRKHERYHDTIKNIPFLAGQAWVYGELFDTGFGYPSMTSSINQKVYGEIYEVDSGQLNELDILEDYQPEGKNNLYERVVQTVHTDNGSVDCFVYVTNRPELLGEPILHGDWKLYRFLKEQPEKVFYFAYGSCMDIERFELAKVDHHFKTVTGTGVLEGYSMKYLFSFPDGSRADIIEDGGTTEGIVYDVPFAAVEYLFNREGFSSGRYRPIFVDILVNDKILTNVLTFHVYNKKGELAPPPHYAAEILRGARGRVSTEYFQKLEEQLKHLGVRVTADGEQTINFRK